ncbi:LysR family transcriptional regulator, pca operon transcriptional activator [Poseidonocella pacifica]|uniref:LysR family transcriptional regulator, pca operon transcriptional activator n=1 Tax=Poseidonocella pacifica TaxID=871651 RepID=A0A1I0Y3L2_9RHOB|nr:pca operon transcription factor PcaQ [Poseidonocella pacifica]SFB07762.1 LysR family transcriptional regulator, pca operon transcriptional activator [Poseidonocella pacifica]
MGITAANRIKLRQLSAFVEVARRKSVTRAAEALNLTQPAVSRALRELEETLGGASLLVREGRGVRLTAHGAALLPHASQALAQVEQLSMAVLSSDHDTGPPLRVGALPTASATLMPEVVARFRQGDLRARLSIITGENQVLLEQLREDRLDLVVGRLPAPEQMLGLAFDPLYRERVVACVAVGHPLLAAHDVVNYADHPMLLPRPKSIIRPLVDRLLMEQGITVPRDAIETVSDSFGLRFTRDYGAVWFISEGVVREALQDGSLARLPLDTDITLGPVGLCTRQNAEPGPAQRRFSALLHDVGWAL